MELVASKWMEFPHGQTLVDPSTCLKGLKSHFQGWENRTPTRALWRKLLEIFNQELQKCPKKQQISVSADARNEPMGCCILGTINDQILTISHLRSLKDFQSVKAEFTCGRLKVGQKLSDGFSISMRWQQYEPPGISTVFGLEKLSDAEEQLRLRLLSFIGLKAYSDEGTVVTLTAGGGSVGNQSVGKQSVGKHEDPLAGERTEQSVANALAPSLLQPAGVENARLGVTDFGFMWRITVDQIIVNGQVRKDAKWTVFYFGEADVIKNLDWGDGMETLLEGRRPPPDVGFFQLLVDCFTQCWCCRDPKRQMKRKISRRHRGKAFHKRRKRSCRSHRCTT